MAKDPAVLFYTADFLIGVADMPFLDRGYYITLLCFQQQKGHLSEETICFLLGLSSVSEIPRVMAKFKRDEHGNFYNEVMEESIRKRAEYAESRRNNGKKGGRPKGNTSQALDNHMQNHMDNHMGNENVNENIDVNNKEDKGVKGEKKPSAFDAFWYAYPKKIGKGEARKAFAKVKVDLQTLLDAIDKQKKSEQWTKNNGQFIPNPSTWLNQGRWEDELPSKAGKGRTDLGEAEREAIRRLLGEDELTE